uniref:PlsC domain-containing protein n=1 Tax=Panagrellus redivivus TaxID=6233 RepID=A0A7E4UMR8_PANRE
MLWLLWNVYLAFIASLVVSTLIVIISGNSWGPIPHWYATFLIFIVERFSPKLRCEPPNGQRLKIVDKRYSGKFANQILSRPLEDVDSDDERPKAVDTDSPSLQLFDVQTEMLQAGVEAIIQDDLLFTCDLAPTTNWNALEPPPFNTLVQWTIYIALGLVRWFVLLPAKCGIFVSSLFWLTGCAVLAVIVKFDERQRLYIGRTFCRLFSASTGLIGYYEKHSEHRPQKPGIAVSNHVSSNDIMVLYSDPENTGYTITGQKHSGIIGWVEKTSDYVASTLWMNRADAKDRTEFQKILLNYATDKTKNPILLFPEGYCTNAVAVSQFRRGCFIENVDVYPIAMRQDSRLGDAFWKEDTYLPYILRLLTSYAIIYHIKYLPSMRRKQNETAESFAYRVQKAIAEAFDADAIPFDLSLLKKKSEQTQMFAKNQSKFAEFVSQM